MAKRFSFADSPTVRYSRSMFDKSHSVKTSMNMGTLYPIDIQEVLPGDTYKFKVNALARLSSEYIRPVMDNIFLDVYSFFVPCRVLFDDFAAVFGENKSNAWAVQHEVTIPTLYEGQNVAFPSSVADYLGLPTAKGGTSSVLNIEPTKISVLPFRAFAKIYDGYFRDQNLIDPMNIQTGETVASEVLNSNEWSPSNYTGMCPKVAKFHDYFTSCLPSPQKGSPVSIAIGGGSIPVSNFSGVVPVYPSLTSLNNMTPLKDTGASDVSAVTFGSISVGTQSTEASLVEPLSSNVQFSGGVQSGSTCGIYSTVSENPIEGYAIPMNLVANLGLSDDVSDGPYQSISALADASQLPAVTVNDLRFAFQTQKLLEKDARGGTRYVEYLASHFGVSVSDYTLRGMEYLGGRRIPLNVIQVAQTTGSDSSSSPLASLGAYSQTMGRTKFAKSFIEHGYILTVACIRQFHTYQLGVEKMFRRINRLDFYDPVFANIGEQPVMKSELFASAGSSSVPFGYQEAWTDMRVRFNRVTGQMRGSDYATQSFDVWNLADDYESAPTLGQDFVEETPDYLDRVITIPSTTADQFLLDFYFDEKCYSVMPTYSFPGLIDHH